MVAEGGTSHLFSVEAVRLRLRLENQLAGRERNSFHSLAFAFVGKASCRIGFGAWQTQPAAETSPSISLESIVQYFVPFSWDANRRYQVFILTTFCNTILKDPTPGSQ